MSREIFNGGIEGAILKIIKDSGDNLTEKQQERLDYLESLPKNEWINLDNNGKMISKQEAEEKELEYLNRFTTLDGKSIIK